MSVLKRGHENIKTEWGADVQHELPEGVERVDVRCRRLTSDAGEVWTEM